MYRYNYIFGYKSTCEIEMGSGNKSLGRLSSALHAIKILFDYIQTQKLLYWVILAIFTVFALIESLFNRNVLYEKTDLNKYKQKKTLFH